MVFKLVRIDAEEPNKIQLPFGTHMIGRGKFLECEDKRISRNHGHLIITEDSVTIEALHQNPCFFTKKGSDEKQVLKKSCKETLDNGDRFGLLPGSYWYEVLLCTADMDSQATDVSNTQELGVADDISTNHENSQRNNRVALDINHEIGPGDDMAADKTINHEHGPNNNGTAEEKTNNENSQNDMTVRGVDENATSDARQGDNEESFVNFDLNETVDNAGRAESPSLLDQQNEPQHDSANQSMDLAPSSPDPTTDNPDPPEPTPENPPEQPESPHPAESKSPKRSHSPDEDDVVKRIKTEPADVKQEVKQEPDDGQAGPSSSQADQAGASKDAGGGKAPPSPAPPAPPRERCIYGLACYRRNLAHKAKFAHPSDADWGAGDHAPCPYGAACRKRDPRHWQVHEHPPQARLPAPGAHAQVVERHGRVFYINAHAVNFYDDHFQVEDSEGDSVDFDYEF